MDTTDDQRQTLSERLRSSREPQPSPKRIPEWRRRELERFARIGRVAVLDLTHTR